MDVLKSLLAARPDKTPEVQALLDALGGFQGLQLAICSVGGVGSTELSNFLTRHAGVACNLLTDQDALRHVNSPPPQLGPATRVVYLFGDPLATVASHYRRRMAYHQALKTAGTALKLEEAAFPASFDDYVTRGEDLFGLERHLANWLNTPSAYDVLFVRYEAMFDPPVTQALFEYVLHSGGAHATQQPDHGAAACSSKAAAASGQQQQLDAARVQQLAATFAASKRERASRVSPEQRAAMYQGLAAAMDALPPIFLRSADCSQRRPLLVPAGGSS